ncbi:unnamed protein product [Ectocarpus sp. 12 AP-2014]
MTYQQPRASTTPRSSRTRTSTTPAPTNFSGTHKTSVFLRRNTYGRQMPTQELPWTPIVGENKDSVHKREETAHSHLTTAHLKPPPNFEITITFRTQRPALLSGGS